MVSVKEVRMWREWVAFDQAVAQWAQQLLDEAEELVTEAGAMPASGDRYSDMADFLREGPFTARENFALRIAVGPHI